MSATVDDVPPVPAGAVPDRPGGFVDVLRAEWTKLWSVRTTWWALIVAAVLSVSIGPWVVSVVVDQSGDYIDPVAVTYGGFHMGIIAFAIVGVLAVTSEYASGMIRLTHAAVPRQLPVLAAKSMVVAALSLPVGLAVSLVTFLLGQQVLEDHGLDVGLGEPGVARAVVGAGLFAAACGVLGVAVGALVRHTAGAITVVTLVLFGGQVFIEVVPDGVARYVPHWAGFAAFTLRPDRADAMLAPWPGFAVFLAYVAATLIDAGWALVRRDT